MRIPDDLIANGYLGSTSFRTQNEYNERPNAYLAPTGSSPNLVLLPIFVSNSSSLSQSIHPETIQLLMEGGDFGH